MTEAYRLAYYPGWPAIPEPLTGFAMPSFRELREECAASSSKLGTASGDTATWQPVNTVLLTVFQQADGSHMPSLRGEQMLRVQAALDSMRSPQAMNSGGGAYDRITAPPLTFRVF